MLGLTKIRSRILVQVAIYRRLHIGRYSLLDQSEACDGIRTFDGIMVCIRARFLAQVTIYHRLRIGRDGHLDQSEASDIS